MQKDKIEEAIKKYIRQKGYARINLKAVLFDMDGVLYNSMPNHAESWTKTMNENGLYISEEEAYMHEGRTGAETIKILCQRQGITMTDTEIKALYKKKTEAFNKCPKAKPIPGSFELLQKVAQNGLTPMLVTGSGQPTLLERLNTDFPKIFSRERMITSFDVKHGKPSPEPYLMALQKGNLQPCEAIVIENAPLGIQAATAAEIFTIAANTGPLPDFILTDAGANMLYPSIQNLCNDWEIIFELLKY